MPLLRTLSTVSSITASLATQLQPGDVAVATNSTSDFAVVATTGIVTTYSTPLFGGSSNSKGDAVLWDPANPNDLLLGGYRFIGRATIHGPGVVSYTRLPLGSYYVHVAQMSWAGPGKVLFADPGVDQMRLLDLTTNTITDLTSGPQPWGRTLISGFFDPNSGDILVGNQGGVFRLPSGQSTVATVASGLGGYIRGLTIDRATGDVIACLASQNRVVRITTAGTVTDLLTPSPATGYPNSIEQDINGDWILGAVNGVFRLPYAGGSPPTPVGPALAKYSVSVVRGNGWATPFGVGCQGQGAPVTLGIDGPLVPTQRTVHRSDNHAPNQLGVALFGLSNTAYANNTLPLALDPLLGTTGCSLHVAIDAALVGVSNGASPATLSFPFSIPAGPTGARFFMQHACLENASGLTSWSNALEVQFP
ncbi:MAG: hypothetical protein NXI31_22605 [bacterium]|nr:hypothetical protein [bacterium]